ncbi:MAG TPA: hypothetical protein PLN52_25610 [Opitutaceae bacterium]|nr:hypothetical protein [Opitutaceae bacterium]
MHTGAKLKVYYVVPSLLDRLTEYGRFVIESEFGSEKRILDTHVHYDFKGNAVWSVKEPAEGGMTLEEIYYGTEVAVSEHGELHLITPPNSPRPK